MTRQHFRRSIHTVLIVSMVALATVLPAAAQDTIHIVQPGETLFRIGLRYNLSVDALAAANSLTNRHQIFAGQQLIIPDASGSDSPIANALVASSPQRHVVQPGETLAAIAQSYGLTPQQLTQMNAIVNPNLLFVGQELQVWANGSAAATTHTVAPGEHLAQIARAYRVDISAIIQANNITNPNTLFAGQQLVIPGTNGRADLGILTGPAAPRPTITAGKQIVVDLSDSRIYAFQDGQLLRTVVVSTGLPQTPTVIGDFNIYFKYEAQTMYGADFYLPDVPYVMYFFEGYAIHGTYWHNNFGQPMSHGCVNLPTGEAEWFFSFGEIGTPVRVQA